MGSLHPSSSSRPHLSVCADFSCMGLRAAHGALVTDWSPGGAQKRGSGEPATFSFAAHSRRGRREGVGVGGGRLVDSADALFLTLKFVVLLLLLKFELAFRGKI
jgi:hypothetical protein